MSIESINEPNEKDKPVLKILYQDEHIVAVDKPSGLFVHRSYMDRDAVYFALQLVRDQIGKYVYPLHRLDRPTSGVLLFGLSEQVAREMGQAFTDKTIQKEYFAITRGHLVGESTVDYPLKEKLDKIGDKYAAVDKAPQDAVTHYQSIATAEIPEPIGKYQSSRYSLIKLLPETGRRHQLRRHLSHLRYPIIGDVNYGDNKHNPAFNRIFNVKRLMLHAYSITFKHPITMENIRIEAPIDEQWQGVFKRLGWSLTLLKQK